MIKSLLITYVCLQFLILKIFSYEASDILAEFHQQEYLIKLERVELMEYDKAYFSKFVIKPFKYNRTAFAINLTFAASVDIGNSLQLLIQLHKFMSNEYRHFPLRIQIPYCSAEQTNMLGMTFPCGNFTGCPLMKGKLNHICNWAPNSLHAPPLVPQGRYKAFVEFISHSKHIALIHGYAEVKIPFKY